MTTFAYYRVSTSDQDYNSQKLGVVEYCKRCGYNIDKEIVDDGVSGCVKAKDRNLWKIVKQAKKGDWLITSELSRIGRSTSDVLQTLNILSQKGVNVYFIKQSMQLDQSPMGKMMVAILSAFAEMERDLIAQRTKEGLERVKREGKRVGRPFGSKNVKGVDLQKLKYLFSQGYKKTEIAKILDVHRNTVTRYYEKAKRIPDNLLSKDEDYASIKDWIKEQAENKLNCVKIPDYKRSSVDAIYF